MEKEKAKFHEKRQFDNCSYAADARIEAEQRLQGGKQLADGRQTEMKKGSIRQ